MVKLLSSLTQFWQVLLRTVQRVYSVVLFQDLKAMNVKLQVFVPDQWPSASGESDEDPLHSDSASLANAARVAQVAWKQVLHHIGAEKLEAQATSALFSSKVSKGFCARTFDSYSLWNLLLVELFN